MEDKLKGPPLEKLCYSSKLHTAFTEMASGSILLLAADRFQKCA